MPAETAIPIINATIPIVSPIADIITNIWQTIQFLVGGIFGLYIILIVFRIYEYKKTSQMLKEIKTDIEKLNKRLSKKKRL